MTDRSAIACKHKRVISLSGGRWQPQRLTSGGGGGRNKSKDGPHVDPWEQIGPPLDDRSAAIAVASR